MTAKKALRQGQKVEDIVRASGISRSTVFRYLAGKSVRPAAATSIDRAIAVLSSAPPGQVSGVKEILVAFPPTYASFRGYAEVLEGLIGRARSSGTAIRIDAAGEGAAAPRGVVIVGMRIADEDREMERWEKAKVPFVLVNRVLEGGDRSWVAVDCRRAAAEAVRHLASRGCRRIAAWVDQDSRVSRDKLQGYRDALAEAGLPDLAVSPADRGLEEAFDALAASAEPPDGWFAPDDEIGLAVLSLAARRGIAVPDELAVVAMNDLAAVPGASTALSSVRLPFREMGEAAFDALDRLVERPYERSVRILLSHRLVERESSARGGPARRSGGSAAGG